MYTCLYMHDWDRLEQCSNPAVRAYFNSVRTTCATVRYAVQLGDIYEEEDFILSTSGLDLGFAAVGAPERPDTALAGLRAAEAWLTVGMLNRLCVITGRHYITERDSAPVQYNVL